MNRRHFLKTGALLAAASTTPLSAQRAKPLLPKNRQETPRVVIVGGGFGGLTAAKRIRQLAPQAEVVVLEKRSHFFSCPYSNAWLGGVTSFETLHRDHFRPASTHGYRIVEATVTAIDRSQRRIESSAGVLHYDYLVLSPGIAYDYTPLFGDDREKARAVYEQCPPALIPGSEHLALVRQLRALKEGNFIITVPPGTFRCPPAPYERACMVAAWYDRHNIKGKVILIDPRTEPMAKPKGFLHTFKNLYPDRIEYIHSAQLTGVDPKSREITFERFDPQALDFVPRTLPYAVANVIPTIRASDLIAKAGLEHDEGGWARLAGPHHQSANDDRVFVIGDAQGEYPYPKSGQMANAQGKVAAEHIAARLVSKKLDPGAFLPFNVCYSLTQSDPATGIVVFHEVSYSPKDGIAVRARDTTIPDRKTAKATADWFGGIMDDIFL